MASSPTSSISEPAIVEQVITEFFAKSVHIILESRSPYVSSRNYSADPFMSSPSSLSSSSFRPRDKWFNLAMGDCPAALENFDLWRQSNLEPLVVDIILSDRRSGALSCLSPGRFFVRNLSSRQNEFGRDKIVERWIVQYESRSSSCPVKETSYRGIKKGNRTGSRSSEFQVMYKKAYMKIIVLLRSLYAVVRLLPAYKLFRDLNASGKIHPLSLSHRISSFVDPFSHGEDAEMNQLGIGPLDTFFGRLSLSVAYLKKVDDVVSEPSTPMSTQFIMDYVGSPLADPLKRFVSLPSSGTTPSCASLSRRHSWSNDHGEIPSFSPTPSPTYSDSRALNHNFNPRLPPSCHFFNASSSSSSPNVSNAACTKKIDDYRSSPPFSPFSPFSSPSPHPHTCKVVICSGSAPVSNPLLKQNELTESEIQGMPPRYSNSKIQGGSWQAESSGTQLSTTSSQNSSPENNLQLKKEPGLMELQEGIMLPKMFSSGKVYAGNAAILKIPSYTTHIPSRSSRRLSFMDEFDDSGFTCPFADDDEATKSCRVESVDCIDDGNLEPGELIPIRRSPDAAVGALVWMLITAPPLRFDSSNTVRSIACFKHAMKNEASDKEIQQKKKEYNEDGNTGKVHSASRLDNTISDPLKWWTAAEALEEFRTYKNMKEIILKRGGSLVQFNEDAEKSDFREPTDA